MRTEHQQRRELQEQRRLSEGWEETERWRSFDRLAEGGKLSEQCVYVFGNGDRCGNHALRAARDRKCQHHTLDPIVRGEDRHRWPNDPMELRRRRQLAEAASIEAAMGVEEFWTLMKMPVRHYLALEMVLEEIEIVGAE